MAICVPRYLLVQGIIICGELNSAERGSAGEVRQVGSVCGVTRVFKSRSSCSAILTTETAYHIFCSSQDLIFRFRDWIAGNLEGIGWTEAMSMWVALPCVIT